jgi:hypothetical protein
MKSRVLNRIALGALHVVGVPLFIVGAIAHHAIAAASTIAMCILEPIIISPIYWICTGRFTDFKITAAVYELFSETTIGAWDRFEKKLGQWEDMYLPTDPLPNTASVQPSPAPVKPPTSYDRREDAIKHYSVNSYQ